MDTIWEKSSERSRSVLFGLLISCLFSEEAKNQCPLSRFRNNLSIEEKYDLSLKLSEEEINTVLEKHEKCFEMRLFASV